LLFCLRYMILKGNCTSSSCSCVFVVAWYKMPPQAHVLKPWSLSMFRGGYLGKWLDHEGSDLISEFIHWWIYNLMTMLGGWELGAHHPQQSNGDTVLLTDHISKEFHPGPLTVKLARGFFFFKEYLHCKDQRKDYN
jgi:hypothetical protein